ncbi:MAG: hypothetical protein ACK4SN_06915 [Bellilinea sp.]
MKLLEMGLGSLFSMKWLGFVGLGLRSLSEKSGWWETSRKFEIIWNASRLVEFGVGLINLIN